MAKRPKPARPLQTGDQVTLRVQTIPFHAGAVGIIREFRNNIDGAQAYIDIGTDGLVVFTLDLALQEQLELEG